MGILLLILIIVGIFFAFKLRGPALKRALKLYTIGGILSLGGCLGSLVWLGGETSGNTTVINDINPYLFAASFFIGVMVLSANSLISISAVKKSRAENLIPELKAADVAEDPDNS